MKKTLKIFILLFLALTILFVGNKIEAATTSLSIDDSEITVGDSVTVTVKYTAAAWDLKVTADSGLSTSSTTHYADSTDSAENESKSFTVKYTASKAGDLYIYLKGDITDESANTADTVSEKVKVTVKEKTTTDKNTGTNTTTNNNSTTDNKNTNTNTNTSTTTQKKEKSNNANLKTLGVRIKDSLAEELGVATNKYDFSGFSKTKTSYNVTIPKNVDSLIVVATPADSNAKVKISGNSGFEVGTNNKITIKVTAEDGKTTKTYTIKVTQLAEEEEKPGNVIEEIYLTSLELKGIELSPEFDKDTYSYTAKLDDVDATEVKVDAKANVENANIEISGNTNLVEGENTINILVSLEDSEEQKIYQIVLTKAEKDVTSVTNTENNETNNGGTLTDLMGNLKKYIVIAVAVVLFIIIAIIVLIILLKRESKKNREDEELEEKAEEYNVYKNDENEFENKSNEADNFIESLYRQRNGNLYNEEELDENEKQTLEEINRETDKIFADKVEGQSVEYTLEEIVEERRPRRRTKGKHSK